MSIAVVRKAQLSRQSVSTPSHRIILIKNEVYSPEIQVSWRIGRWRKRPSSGGSCNRKGLTMDAMMHHDVSTVSLQNNISRQM